MFKAIFLWTLLFGICTTLNAQFMNAIDTSLTNQSKYRSSIEANNDMVQFINNILLQNDLPKMLSNLALIESGFNKYAVSNKNAGGVWQFTVAHAADYGLSDADRFDVYKSTQVAVKSLHKLNGKYNNWLAVVAAFNCGEGNLDKAILKAKSKSYRDYAKYLPDETVGHVQKFMEACFVTNDFQNIFFDYKYAPPEVTDTSDKTKVSAMCNTEINSGFDMDVIADMLHIDVNNLLKWNPDINTKLAEKGDAPLFLPADIMSDFQLLKTQILQASLNHKNHERSKL